MAEFDWISRYFAPLAGSRAALCLSDDVALLEATSSQLIVTQDAIVEGVHFLQGTPPDRIAAKLVAVNASDIRAKGGQCLHALLTLGVPEQWTESDIAAFASGLGLALGDVNADLVGGDTVRAPTEMFASLTMIGVPMGKRAVLRSGAAPGDEVWVSGIIGHGLLGLDDSKAGRNTPSARHYAVPDIMSEAVARLIAGHASAAMDISDGLLADAAKLAAASKAGLALDLDAVPFADPAAERFSWLDQATGGDDYQALFTASPADREILASNASGCGAEIHRIGRVTDSGVLEVFRAGNAVGLPSRLGFSHGG